MKFPLALLALIVIAALVLPALRNTARRSRRRPQVSAKRLLTDREEAMYNRLTTTLPEHRVLAQVSFGALLTSQTQSDRNYFDRKIADFVVCDKALRPAAIIELDDASHHTKGRADDARDAMLRAAGYRVIRYANIPDSDRVRRDFPPAPGKERQ